MLCTKMYITKVIQRPKWSLISAKYCDIMWALLLLEIEINLYFVTAEMSQQHQLHKFEARFGCTHAFHLGYGA